METRVEAIIEEVQRGNHASGDMSLGELKTVVAMYPPHHTGDQELNAMRKALRILQGQRQNDVRTE